MLARFKGQPKPAAIAVDGIGHHSRCACPGFQHALGQLGLGGKVHSLGHNGRDAPGPIVGPLCGQVQLAVEKRVPPACGVGQKHPHLAVLRLAGGAAVLALDADAFGPLLEEARFIHDELRPGVPQLLKHVAAQLVADRVGVPPGPTQ